MLVLTAKQAETVRGPTGPCSWLEPRQLEDDLYILNPCVLEDPMHKCHWEFLSKLPIEDVVIPEPKDDDA